MSIRRDTIRVTSSLREFYGVCVIHDYYRSIVCKDLSFEPTPRTKALLKNYNLLFRPLNYGFIILYDPVESPKLLKNSALKSRLSFIVSNKNLKFQNFTEIPFIKEGFVYHFSSLPENYVDLNVDNIPEVFYNFRKLSLGENRKKLLHFNDHSEISVRPSKFILSARQIHGNETETKFKYIDIEIQDEWGETTFADGKPYKRAIEIVRSKEINYGVQKELRKHQDLSNAERGQLADELRKKEIEFLNNYESREVIVDLSHAPEGRYKILHQGKEIQEIYVADGVSERVFGVLDVHLDAQFPNLIDRNTDDLDSVINPQLSYVYFQSRKTYWRYHFLNYPDSMAKPVSIQDERDEISFGDPSQVLLQNTGEPAILIESKDKIKLEEKPDNYFFLQRKSGNRTLKEIRLPSPSPDMVKPIKEENEYKIYSDIFVYL